MLNISQKALLKDKITSKLKTLEEDISFLEETTRPIAPENAIGRVSRMDAINNKSIAEESLRNARLNKTKLEEALLRLADSDFGLCFKCKEAIDFERLLYLPETRICVACR
ncbi:MAG: TraR/DksA C4-type zinc finger protein [Chitinophagales bacterium]|nr:TraR/DksA C4-type zinc finger protein [Bacteroidota bacterium]MCB9257130.1 TraR/DksA C4-type zinc finger protein [Chitinophagales bacterium]